MPRKRTVIARDLDPCTVAHAYWSLSPEERGWEQVAKALGLDHTKKAVQNCLGKIARQWEEKGFVRHEVLSAVKRPWSEGPGSPAREILRGMMLARFKDMLASCRVQALLEEWERTAASAMPPKVPQQVVRLYVQDLLREVFGLLPAELFAVEPERCDEGVSEKAT